MPKFPRTHILAALKPKKHQDPITVDKPVIKRSTRQVKKSYHKRSIWDRSVYQPVRHV